jgi:biotin carboxyl carrier protein
MPEKHLFSYKVKVNDFEFSFTEEQLAAIDLVKISPNQYNLLNGRQSINATVEAADDSDKRQTITIKGDSYQVQIRDEMDQLLDQMGFNKVAAQKIKEIKAPMPGLVLQIAVSEGQRVQPGEKVLILVAMKMENAIMTSTEATISRVAVKPGEAVEKGQVLVELE